MEQNEWDQMMDALANAQRRRMLIDLLDRSPPRANSQFDVIGDGGVETDSLQIELHHTHLPKLESYGYARWDSDEEKLRKGANFSEIYPLLELIEENRENLPDGLV